MKSWRPALIVRRGRGGGVSSPVATRGYVLKGLIGLVLCTVGVIGSARGNLFNLAYLLFGGYLLRDAIAWFAATDEEREAFRHEVQRAPAVVTRPRTPTIWEGRLGPALGFLLAGVALFVAGLLSQSLLILAGTAALIFGVASMLDVLRRAVTTRRAASATRSR